MGTWAALLAEVLLESRGGFVFFLLLAVQSMRFSFAMLGLGSAVAATTRVIRGSLVPV